MALGMVQRWRVLYVNITREITTKATVGLARCGSAPHPQEHPFCCQLDSTQCTVSQAELMARRPSGSARGASANITRAQPVTLFQVPRAAALHGRWLSQFCFTDS